MNKELVKTIICLRISSVIYILIGIIMLLFLPFIGISGLVLVPFIIIMLGIGLFVEFIIRDLKRGKQWSWYAALIMSGLYVSSIFIILGIIGIIGLVQKPTRKAFKIE